MQPHTRDNYCHELTTEAEVEIEKFPPESRDDLSVVGTLAKWSMLLLLLLLFLGCCWAQKFSVGVVDEFSSGSELEGALSKGRAVGRAVSPEEEAGSQAPIADVETVASGAAVSAAVETDIQGETVMPAAVSGASSLHKLQKKVEMRDATLVDDADDGKDIADSIAQPLGDLEGHVEDLNKFFAPLERVQAAAGTELIKSLPLSSYFDVIKGAFRFGALGDQVKESLPQFPDLVQSISRRVVNKGESQTMHDIAVLNTPDALMYGLGALKDADSRLQVLVGAAEEAQGVRRALLARAQEVEAQHNASQAASEAHGEPSAALLLARARAVEARAGLYYSLVVEQEQRTAAQGAALGERSRQRQRQRKEGQERLLALFTQHNSALRTDKDAFLAELEQLRRARADAKLGQQEQELVLEFGAEAQRLADEVRRVEVEADVAVEEAFRVAKETEQTALNIIRAEGRSAQEQAESYLSTLLAEARLCVLSLFGDLRSAAWSGGMLLALVLAVVAVQELAGALRFVLAKLSGKRLRVEYQQGPKASRLDRQQRVPALPLCAAARQELGRLSKRLDAAMRTRAGATAAPAERRRHVHALVCGLEGCGQVAAAAACAFDSGQPFCVLEAEALLRLGPSASLFLRDLCDAHTRQGRPLVLVLAGANEVVAPRGGGAPEGTDRAAARACLYALLGLMKDPAGLVSVLLCVGRAALRDKQFPAPAPAAAPAPVPAAAPAAAPVPAAACSLVDAALLSRLDCLQELPPPTPALRELYALQRVAERLGPYLPGDALAQVVQRTQAEAAAEAEAEAEAEEGKGRDKGRGKGAGKGKGKGKGKDKGAEAEAEASPETHVPASPRRRRSSSSSSSKERSTSTAGPSFDVPAACLALRGPLTHGWVLADLDRLVDRCQASALGTRRCLVTTELFVQQLEELRGGLT